MLLYSLEVVPRSPSMRTHFILEALLMNYQTSVKYSFEAPLKGASNEYPQVIWGLLTSTDNICFHGEIKKKVHFWLGQFCLDRLTLILLNQNLSCLANGVDLDQMTSEEDMWSRSTLFAIQFMNL